MVVTATLVVSIASALAIVGSPCSNLDCEKDAIRFPYPTKQVYRTTIAAEHTVYQATHVKVGVTDSFGVEGGYLTYKGLSSGSPKGGALIIGSNGTYSGDLLNDTGIPTYLTSTRDPAGTAAYGTWTNVARWFNVSNVWNAFGAIGNILLKLLF